MSSAATATLIRMLLGGALRANRGRLALTVLAVALGVALATAVHLINYSAVAEMSAAVRSLAGDTDVTVRGPRVGVDEDLYPKLARREGVSVASPQLEIDAKLVDRPGTLRILALDPFRAAVIQPMLLGDAAEHLLALLEPNTALLSASAANQLALDAGQTLDVQVGTRVIGLRILGVLPANESITQPLALMDIGNAQWALDHLGVLNRIDLRLASGTDRKRFVEALNGDLPAGVRAAEIEVSAQQSVALSRAYRVNLNMLALVSIFTGAVLIYTTQWLTLLRRRTQFALLLALGMSRKQLVTLLTAEAMLIGITGTTLGIALGIGASQLGVSYTGGDLGAGFFASSITRARIDMFGLSLIVLVGIAAALLSGFLPAREVVNARLSGALRAGDEQASLARQPSLIPGIGFLVAGAILATLPPIAQLPVFGYVAIASLLIGTLVLLPAAVRGILRMPSRTRAARLKLPVEQLRGTAGYAGVSLAAIVASFSVAIAMLIMIQSFRVSLDDWLQVVLPADLYARSGSGSSAYIEPEVQSHIRSLAALRQVVFSRHTNVAMDPLGTGVTLIARDLDNADTTGLYLLGPSQLPTDDTAPAWISEAVRDRSGVSVGGRITIPIAGKAAVFTVAGIVRDYARPGGSIVIERSVYQRLSADSRATEAWIWIAANADPQRVIADLRMAVGSTNAIEIREPGLIRALSMAQFDRTFAVTYGLQAVAIVIGLFGISVGTSAQAIARRREFGMLQHLGMTRGHIAALSATEGGILGLIGALIGIALGATLSAVLIHVINAQSFHWSMETHFPATPMAAWSIVLVIAAALTAAISARQAMSTDAVMAVKDDW
jgi:putative ABC transport system permease protein